MYKLKCIAKVPSQNHTIGKDRTVALTIVKQKPSDSHMQERTLQIDYFDLALPSPLLVGLNSPRTCGYVQEPNDPVLVLPAGSPASASFKKCKVLDHNAWFFWQKISRFRCSCCSQSIDEAGLLGGGKVGGSCVDPVADVRIVIANWVAGELGEIEYGISFCV